MKKNIDIKQRTKDWIKSLRVEGQPFGRFRMSSSTDDTIFTSCFASFIFKLVGGVEELTDKERLEWLDFILSHQDEKTGLFMDKFSKDRNLSASHDIQYVTWQLTTFCISAVRSLKGELRFPLKFLEHENLHKKEIIKKKLESFNWKNPWGAGNLAMFLGIMLIVDAEYYGRDLNSDKSIQYFFDWHDEYQNPKTGFWGEGKINEYHNGLFGAYHQYLLYFYVGRELNFKTTIIDKTISFQNFDGLFAPQLGGGACEDIDAIDTLVQCYLRSGHRTEDVKNVLKKSYDAIMALEAEGGGFIWGIKKYYGPSIYLKMICSILKVKDIGHWLFLNRRFIREQQLNPLKPRHPEGWVSRGIPINESDLFSTWFRLLSIVYISMIIETPESKLEWEFLESPGLGWFRCHKLEL